MATQQFSLPLELDLVPLTKQSPNGNPDTLQDLYRLYNATKLIANGLDAYTGIVGAAQADWPNSGSGWVIVQNMCRLYVQFAAAATPGQLIALNGSSQAILATVGNVIGWVPTSVANGAYGEVRLLGLHVAITGLTPGVSYYASATPGGITSTVTAQKVGFAIAATRLFFNPN
jgi:hypothetical protein